MQYDFIITLEDGTIINPGNPKGWEGMELVLTKDKGQWLIEFSSSVEYYGPVYQQLRDYIKGTGPNDPGNPCSINTIEILGRCNELEPFSLIVLATWQASGVEFDCNKCTISIKPTDTGGIQRINEVSSNDYCFSGNDTTLFEVESCFDFVDQFDRPFVTLLEALQGIGNALGVDIQSTVLSTEFTSHIIQIECPALGPGESLVCTIETALGDTLEATVTEAGTAEETAEKIRLLYLQGLGNSTTDDPAFLARRLATVKRTGATLDIESWSEIQSVLVQIDSVTVLNSFIELQPYQWGLKGLAISNEGLTRFENTCLSFQFIMDILEAFAPFTVRELDGIVYIDPEPVQYQNAGPFTASIKVDNYTEIISDEWLYAHINVGSDFTIKKYDESQAAWVWEAPTVEDSEQLSGATYPGNPISYPVNRLGLAVIRGDVLINNPSGNTSGQLNVTVGSQLIQEPITLSAGVQLYDIVLDLFNGIDQSLCYEVGDTLTVELIGFAGATFETGTNLRLDFNVNPYSAPVINENIHDNVPLFDLLTYQCKDSKAIRLKKSVYGLTGYGISQQMKGLEDYGDTYFLTFIDQNDPSRARAFKMGFYDPFGCQDCNQQKEWCFYNIPIQKPFIAQQYAPVIPQDLDSGGLLVQYTWQAGGCLNQFATASNNAVYQRVKTNVCEVRANDLCLSVTTIRALISELGADITTACDNRTFASGWKNINFSLADGSTSATFETLS